MTYLPRQLVRTLRRRFAAVAVDRPPAGSFPAWARDLFPHYCVKPPSTMHEWFGPRLQRLGSERGSRVNVLAPRGEAKSTWGTLFYPLYAALEQGERFIWVISDTQSLTREHLRNLRAELEFNPRLADAYPREIGTMSAAVDRIELGNGCTIVGLSTGQNLRGRRRRAERPGLIVLDDPEGEDDAISPTRRERNRRWFHDALLRAGNERTNVVVLGTAIHPDCLVLRLHQTAGWDSRVFRSVISWPTNMHLWAEWEGVYLDHARPDREAAALAFYERNKADMDEGAELLWPERFSLYQLMCERAPDHVSFDKERQNNPVDPASVEWPPELFEGDDLWFDQWPGSDVVARSMGVDPSKSADARTGDYRGIAAMALTRDGLLWVDADGARTPAAQVAEDVVNWQRKFRADIVVFEVNQFLELFHIDLERVAAERGVPVPTEPVNNSVNKVVRIRRLGPYLHQRRIRFKRSAGARMLVEQLRQFPTGEHDDLPDAAEMALRGLTRITGE